jgi:hypothetical protein
MSALRDDGLIHGIETNIATKARVRGGRRLTLGASFGRGGSGGIDSCVCRHGLARKGRTIAAVGCRIHVRLSRFFFAATLLFYFAVIVTGNALKDSATRAKWKVKVDVLLWRDLPSSRSTVVDDDERMGFAATRVLLRQGFSHAREFPKPHPHILTMADRNRGSLADSLIPGSYKVHNNERLYPSATVSAG